MPPRMGAWVKRELQLTQGLRQQCLCVSVTSTWLVRWKWSSAKSKKCRSIRGLDLQCEEPIDRARPSIHRLPVRMQELVCHFNTVRNG